MKMPWLAAGAALGLVAFGATPPASAQAPGGQNPSVATPPPPSQARPQKSARARVEERITELHQRLQITSTEEPKWQAFANAMRENAANMEQAFAAQRGTAASGTALQDLQDYARLAELHARDVQRLVPLFTALYDEMPAAQKQQTDQVFRSFAQHKRRHGPA